MSKKDFVWNQRSFNLKIILILNYLDFKLKDTSLTNIYERINQ